MGERLGGGGGHDWQQKQSKIRSLVHWLRGIVWVRVDGRCFCKLWILGSRRWGNSVPLGANVSECMPLCVKYTTVD